MFAVMVDFISPCYLKHHQVTAVSRRLYLHVRKAEVYPLSV